VAPLVAALLLATSCGGSRVPSGVATDATDATRMFAAGYSNIGEMYIDQVDLAELATAGLANLNKLDPEMTIVRRGRQVDLAFGGHPAGAFETPTSLDPEAWAAVTASALDLARSASPALASEGTEDVYKAVFDGIIGKLDRFSRYSTAESAREHRAAREGFGGIGIRVAIEDAGVRVSSVMEESPSYRSGLKADDIITHIDREPVQGWELQTVIQRLRGPVGSTVTLTLRRGSAEPYEVTLGRAHIVPETVVYQRRGNAAHIRLYSFNQDTTRSLSQAIRRARKEVGKELSGIILDLRDNPGGLLDQAVSVSDVFMTGGRIVSTHGRHPESHQFFDASSGDLADGLPVVVLVNGNSASASEIVAAALQDNGRAVVAGSNSYGKGTVQTVIRMPNQGEMTLTWARFHAPSGYTIHHLGVLPSICTGTGDEDAEAILAALSAGRLKPLPIARRNAAKPDDQAALADLRGACPARPSDEDVDVQVAARLVADRGLYAQALRLALPANLASAPGADTAVTHP
jgi:carboxyl-terminal processing protease